MRLFLWFACSSWFPLQPIKWTDLCLLIAEAQLADQLVADDCYGTSTDHEDYGSVSVVSSDTDGITEEDPDGAVEPSILPQPANSGSVGATDGSAMQAPDLPDAQSVPDGTSDNMKALCEEVKNSEYTVSPCSPHQMWDTHARAVFVERTRTHMHAHTHARTQTHTHTHTHTHTRSGLQWANSLFRLFPSGPSSSHIRPRLGYGQC